MAKMQIYEIAKEVNKKSKDIISFLNDKGINVTSHMSNIYDEGINLVRKEYGATPNTNDRQATNNKQDKQGQNNRQQDTRRRDKPQQNNSRQNNKNIDSSKQDNRNQNTSRQDNRKRDSKLGDNKNKSNNNQYKGNANQDRDNTQRSSSNHDRDKTRQNRPTQNRDNTQGSNSNHDRDNTGRNRPSQNRDNTQRSRPSQDRDNQNKRNPNNQGQRSNYKSEAGQDKNKQNNTRQNRNYQKPTNRNNTSGNSDMRKKDFISDKLNNIENDRTNSSKSKKKTNADVVASRNETANRKAKPKKRNNNYNTNKSSENKGLKKGQFIKPKLEKKVEEKVSVIKVGETITIKELAKKMRIDASDIIKKLFLTGKVVTINEDISYGEAEEIAIEYDILVEEEEVIDEVEEALKEDEDDPTTLEKRSPVVCVMGHVDHGKTSLLDAIRETNVTSGEAGGITQHIGAYVVEKDGRKITFLDTPGHEAFTSMRMRGAQSTDIAILVVAADDGVMPQTVEAINHAKAAGIEIIIAVNKIDKPSANVERVKQELVEYGLVAEDWGGDTIFVPVSAHTGEGIDTLLEMLVLTSELLELTANPNRKARGLVVEAELDKGRGPVATVLVQKGTLHVGDPISVGTAYGNVRAMVNDKGRRIEEAGPSTPVEILGLSEVPTAGEIFVVSKTEKDSRQLAETYLTQNKERLIANTKPKLSLDGLFSEIKAGNLKELNIIVKADVQGSVEAMRQSLEKLSNDEVAVRVIHGGVGAINESDVTLASASNAIIIGFNVRPDNNAKDIGTTEEVDMRLYRVIYNAIEDVENAMKGMLDPTYEEKVTGHIEIREVYKASGVGNIAGCYVNDGFITRTSQVRLIRDNIVIYDGTLNSLKRFQDDVKEVKAGFECGIVFEKYSDIKVGDKIEAYVMEEIPR